MSSTPTASEIWRDARWLMQALDPRAGLVRVIELAPDDYRDASFLDDRILKGGHVNHLLKWTGIEQAWPAQARADARWIFHIGHVGSTLISRLLGELPAVLAVREPRALRDLTFFPADVRNRFIPMLRALMSRTFKKEDTAIIKATSMVAEIAAELIGDSRGLFIHASPRMYIQTILAGQSSTTELQSLADFYRARARRAGIALGEAPGSTAEIAALVWACEITALESAAEKLADTSLIWLDFDQFLNDPAGHLSTISRFLGVGADPGQVAAIANGPLMGRYSKALEYDFGPETRRHLLANAARAHSGDIAAALAMLNSAAEGSPLLARALSRAED